MSTTTRTLIDRNTLGMGRGDFTRITGINQSLSTVEATVWGCTGEVQWPIIEDFLSIVSTSANDTLLGTGARQIVIDGLDIGMNQLPLETISLNGLTPVISVQKYARVNRMYILTTGTYSTGAANGANIGTITADYQTSTLPASCILNDRGKGMSTDAIYTVPKGKSLLVQSFTMEFESTKIADVFAWTRGGADTLAAPFVSKQIAGQWKGLQGGNTIHIDSKLSTIIPECTDMWINAVMETGTGFMAVYVTGDLVDNHFVDFA